MAILLNGEPHPHREGMTVEQLLAEKKFTFPMKNVFINGQRIPRADWPAQIIRDGDQVNVVHLMGGG